MNRFVSFEDVDLTIEQHHAHPALGSTGLKRYLSDSKPKTKDANIGNAVHALVVEPETADRVILKKTFGGKGSVADRKAWEKEHADYLYFSQAELEKVHAMSESLKRCKSLMQLLNHPAVEIEHTVLAKTDTDVWCKSRVDIRGPGYIGKPVRVMVDIKTTSDPDDDLFAKSVATCGYDLQGALYGDIERQRHIMDVVYYLYGVQKTPPHRVMRMRVPDEWMHVGRMLYEAAVLKAEYHRHFGHRAELHWEGDRVLPPPPKWHVQRAERILDHARSLSQRVDADRQSRDEQAPSE